MIPKEGQRFKVSFKSIRYTYEAVITGRTWDGLYKLNTFNRLSIDANGVIDRRNDDSIEVEPKWFDESETTRIITLIENKDQLKIFVE